MTDTPIAAYYRDHAEAFRESAQGFRLLLCTLTDAPPAERLRWLKSATECDRLADAMTGHQVAHNGPR
jgi:hypothetical protein